MNDRFGPNRLRSFLAMLAGVLSDRAPSFITDRSASGTARYRRRTVYDDMAFAKRVKARRQATKRAAAVGRGRR